MKHRNHWILVATLILASTGGISASVTAQNPTPYPCLSSGPDASAGSWHCSSTYDLGLTGDVLSVREGCEAAGGVPCTTVFGDGNNDIGGVIYDGCSSPRHATANSLPSSDKSANRDWPHCKPQGNGAWSLVTVYITDAIFGADVAGFFCIDLNGDDNCGNPADGEVGAGFCSTNDPTFIVPNYAVTMSIFVLGPIFQSDECPGTANPIGGTTGTINVWITPTTAPQCSDGVDNDGDGYTDWGYRTGWPDRCPSAAFPGNVGGGCTDVSDDSEGSGGLDPFTPWVTSDGVDLGALKQGPRRTL